MGSQVTVCAAFLAMIASCVTEDVVREKPESVRVLEGLFQTGDRPEISVAPLSRWDELREQFDGDADGILWPHELPNRDFERFDRNCDGFVSLRDYPVESGELDAWVHYRLESGSAQKVLRRALGIGDAAATKTWQELFFAIDLNANRGIDRAEFRAVLGPTSKGRSDGISALLDLADVDGDDQLGWFELDDVLERPRFD